MAKTPSLPISKIDINGAQYSLVDTEARAGVSALKQSAGSSVAFTIPTSGWKQAGGGGVTPLLVA